jgi:hypothetical protein
MLVLSGCASTTLVSSLKTAGVPAKKYASLLVVGLSETPATRQVFEEIFGDELRKRGISSISSYTIAELQGKTSPTRAAFAAALKTSGADGLLTTRFVKVKSRRDTKTGFVMTDRGTYFDDFYDYYGNDWVGIDHYATFDSDPVNEVISSVTTLETALFDAGTGKLIWKGVSNESNADKLMQSTKELASLVLDALSSEGLLKSK